MSQEFVRSLEIAPAPAQALRSAAPPAAARAVAEGADKEVDKKADFEKPSGYVAGGSLVSFGAGVPEQNQRDVLNSTLLAQLAANKRFGREAKPVDWYRFYVDVLGKLGWSVPGFDFQAYTSEKLSFTADEVVLEIAAAELTGNELAIITATLDALKKLPKEDGRLQLFDRSSRRERQGNFQISVCNEQDGVVAMKNMAFTFSSDENVTSVLSFTFASASTRFRQAAQAQRLNQVLYASVRQSVLEKLGHNAWASIADLDI